jgi:hypothetical protein
VNTRVIGTIKSVVPTAGLLVAFILIFGYAYDTKAITSNDMIIVVLAYLLLLPLIALMAYLGKRDESRKLRQET